MDKHELIIKFIPLAHNLAKKYSARFPRFRDDYMAAARLGLVQAANRFIPKKKTLFSTFAKRRIKGALLDMHRSLDLQGYRRKTETRPRVESFSFQNFIFSEDRETPEALLEAEDNILSIIHKVSEYEYPVFKGIYIDHKTHKVIAAEMGVPLNRVAYLHRTGLERLRRLLGAGV